MSPNVSLLATAVILITFLVAQVVGDPGLSDPIQERNLNGPPPGWNFVGCYDDSSGFRTPATPNGADNRTLKAQQFNNATGMTPTMCIEFCSNFEFPYGFAGVELGQECWCDGVIQLTANLTNSSECDIPCSGDGTEICGGTSRISIFTDGTPSPKIPTVAFMTLPDFDAEPVPPWNYIGCYSDSIANRTLGSLLSNVEGVDANTCAAACAEAFPNIFLDSAPIAVLFSGVESGDECWCGTSISGEARRLPDIACESMGCLGSNDQACGGDFAIAVYQIFATQLQDCEGEQFFTPFQLNAVFLDEPSTSVPITMTSLIFHNNEGSTSTDAGILSYCPTCPNPITFELDEFSQWELAVFQTPNIAINNLTVVHAGGMVNFVEITDDDRLFVGYCAARSSLHQGVIELTAFGMPATPFIPGIPDNFVSFALCANMTAGGRQDIVYTPLIGRPGYNLSDCRNVSLEMDFNVTVPVGTSIFELT